MPITHCTGPSRLKASPFDETARNKRSSRSLNAIGAAAKLENAHGDCGDPQCQRKAVSITVTSCGAVSGCMALVSAAASANAALHCSRRWQSRSLLFRRPLVTGAKCEDRDARRPWRARKAASCAKGVYRRTGCTMRLLHQWHDHGVGSLSRYERSARRDSRQNRACQ